MPLPPGNDGSHGEEADGARVLDFGGRHTGLKEEVVVRYLDFYLTALKNKGFTLTYVDAFAGSGWRRAAGGGRTEGCALRVLGMQKTFNRYVFGDLDAANVASLTRAAEEQCHRWAASGHFTRLPNVSVRHADANQLIEAECARLQKSPQERAVVFLDPFGMQVNWRTLEAIKATGAIDLWLLLPLYIGVSRMLPHSGRMPAAWERRIDDFLGYTEWRSEVWQVREEPDLFSGTSTRKERVSEAQLEKIVMGRFRSLFGSGLLPNVLQLPINERRSYTLVFACSSPNPQAVGLAHKAARHIVEKAPVLRVR